MKFDIEKFARVCQLNSLIDWKSATYCRFDNATQQNLFQKQLSEEYPVIGLGALYLDWDRDNVFVYCSSEHEVRYANVSVISETLKIVPASNFIIGAVDVTNLLNFLGK